MIEPELTDYPAVTVLTKSATCGHAELGPTIGTLFGQIGKANPEAEMTGAPRVYYTEWNPDNCTIEGAMPVKDGTPAGEGTIAKIHPAGTALSASYFGHYSGLAEAWETMWNRIAELGLNATGLCWDDYQTDPGLEPDATKWQTDIYIAVKIPKI